jgi:hypothetical protein
MSSQNQGVVKAKEKGREIALDLSLAGDRICLISCGESLKASCALRQGFEGLAREEERENDRRT